MIKKVLFLLLFIVLLFGTIRPFFVSGFFPMHDDAQVARVYEMGKALHDGMFPVRWSEDLGYGYGYPLFNFYAPFAYYIGGILMLFGMSALLATKTMMAIGILFAGISMYLLGKALWGEKGGFVSGLLYAYATYHAVDIFVRGDVAEFWAYALLPLICYGLVKISQTQQWKYVALTALSYGALICTHNLSALMVTPLLILWMVIVGWKAKKQVKAYLGIAFLVGILLAAFYWVPVFGEMRYTNVLSQIGGGADFHDHFVCLQQFWYSPWGFGGSVPGCTDGLSFMIGKIVLLLSAISLFFAILFYRKNTKNAHIVMLFAIGLGSSLFLATSYSLFLWNGLKPMAFFQYPWRFLFLASFLSALLGGSVMMWLEEWLPILKKREALGWGIAFIISIVIIVFQLKLFVPQLYLLRSSKAYTNTVQLTWVTSKISDEYLPPKFNKPRQQSEIPQKIVNLISGTVKVQTNLTQQKEILLTLPSGQVVQINQAFFPGWVVSIDGKKTRYEQTPYGISSLVPGGTHTVTLIFQQTLIERVGDMLSLTGILILVIGIIYVQKRPYGKKS